VSVMLRLLCHARFRRGGAPHHLPRARTSQQTNGFDTHARALVGGGFLDHFCTLFVEHVALCNVLNKETWECRFYRDVRLFSIFSQKGLLVIPLLVYFQPLFPSPYLDAYGAA
jgi:hypothetical protein